MSEEKKYTFRCTVCGWEVTVDTPELPEDFGHVRARRGVARGHRCDQRGRPFAGAAPFVCFGRPRH